MKILKYIKTFMALAVFLLVLSVFAFAVAPISDLIIGLYSNGDKRYTPNGCSDTVETYCYGSWCSGNITCPSCTSTSQSRSCSGNVLYATGGTQYRYRSVTSGCSSCSYGSWGSYTGTCTCKSGYTWDGSSCTKATNYGTYRCTYVGGNGSAGCLMYFQEEPEHQEVGSGSSSNGDITGKKCGLTDQSYPCRNFKYNCYCDSSSVSY